MKTFSQILEELESINEDDMVNRNVGDEFVDGNENPLYFQSLEFFDSLDAANEKLKTDISPNYDLVSKGISINKQLTGLTKIAVVRFSKVVNSNSPKNDVVYYKFVKPTTTDIPNTILPHFKYKSKSSAKNEAKLSPIDIFGISGEEMTVDQLLTILRTHQDFIDKPYFIKAAEETLKHGYPVTTLTLDPTNNTQPYFEAIRDNFSEILAVLSIISGKYDGNGKAGVETLLGTTNLKDAKISFPKTKNHPLYDSKITLKGKSLLVSSKSGDSKFGTDSSLTNIYTLYDPNNTQLINSLRPRYNKQIEIARWIAKEDSVVGLVEVAKLLNIKNYNYIAYSEPLTFANEDAEYIKDWRNSNDLGQYKDQKLPVNLQHIYNAFGLDTTKKNSKSPVAFYSVLSALARFVSFLINIEDGVVTGVSKFSEFATTVLNGAMIQITSKLQYDKTGKVKYLKFNAMWPSQAVTKVQVTSSIRYTNVANNGKLTYNISYRE